MNTEGYKRKLFAILSADVEGYSRLMDEDEDATIRTLINYRQEMTTLIQKHRGFVVDTPGDNLLARFSSIMGAVRCAEEIQEELKIRNAELPENRRMHFRIGINLGDVVEEQDRLYGDGINIATRVEGLAEGGGVCISGIVYDSIKNKLSHSYEFLGEHKVKNISEPVRVYRMRLWQDAFNQKKPSKKQLHPASLAAAAAIILIAGAVGMWRFYFYRSIVEPASLDKMAYPLPDKPSIAVLPFSNISGDPDQDYIADGLSENIIDALSVSSKFFVIARTSTFAYKNRPVKVQQVAEDLGVQYILEGSIQESGERLRVTAQLIDALSGHHLWSQKYDREMKELFDLQDEITKNIVVSLHVQLPGAELARMTYKFTGDLEVMKHLIQGTDLREKMTKADNERAKEHFNAAISIDPKFVPAYTALALCYQYESRLGWSDSPADSADRALELAKKAVALDEQYPVSHAHLGNMYLYRREHEKALAEGIKAITLNPNLSIGYAFLGHTMFYCGRFEEAIEMLNKAFRLNPLLAPIFKFALNKSYIFLKRYDEAHEVLREMEQAAKKNQIPPWAPPLDLAWFYEEIGKEEEARANMATALEMNPYLSVKWYVRNAPYKNPDHLMQEINALRKAGLPEEPVKSAIQ